ncbi:MAG: hypothetical protein M1828_003845 [Chrysothrix sp. TS-e1954]|nr:MAG: hypothetical protein M1828_003845 [Chrysothrix sp. TS-e1954]
MTNSFSNQGVGEVSQAELYAEQYTSDGQPISPTFEPIESNTDLPVDDDLQELLDQAELEMNGEVEDETGEDEDAEYEDAQEDEEPEQQEDAADQDEGSEYEQSEEDASDDEVEDSSRGRARTGGKVVPGTARKAPAGTASRARKGPRVNRPEAPEDAETREDTLNPDEPQAAPGSQAPITPTRRNFVPQNRRRVENVTRLPQEDWVPERPTGPFNCPNSPAVWACNPDLPIRAKIVLRIIRLEVKKGYQRMDRSGMPNRCAIARILRNTGYNTFVDREGGRGEDFFGPRGDLLRNAILRRYHINDLGMSRNLWDDLCHKDGQNPRTRPRPYERWGPNTNRSAALIASEVPCASDTWIDRCGGLPAGRDDDTDDSVHGDLNKPNKDEDAMDEGGQDEEHLDDDNDNEGNADNEEEAEDEDEEEEDEEEDEMEVEPEEDEVADETADVDMAEADSDDDLISPSAGPTFNPASAYVNNHILDPTSSQVPPSLIDPTIDPAVLQQGYGFGPLCSTHSTIWGIISQPCQYDVQPCRGVHHGPQTVNVCIDCYERKRDMLPYPRNTLYWNGALMPLCTPCASSALDPSTGAHQGCLCPTTTRERLCHTCLDAELDLTSLELQAALDLVGSEHIVPDGPYHVVVCKDCHRSTGPEDSARRCMGCTQVVCAPYYNEGDPGEDGTGSFLPRCGPCGFVSRKNAKAGREVLNTQDLFLSDDKIVEK